MSERLLLAPLFIGAAVLVCCLREPGAPANSEDLRPTLLERVEIDHGADYTVDAVVTYRYTVAGLLVEVQTDSDNDGTPDFVEWREYDEWGRLVTVYHDGGQQPPDGVFDYRERYVYAAGSGLVEP